MRVPKHRACPSELPLKGRPQRQLGRRNQPSRLLRQFQYGCAEIGKTSAKVLAATGSSAGMREILTAT
jgi:hypothetical protein